MGEKTYFYTDPLAAAWMFKNHGILITVGNRGTNGFIFEMTARDGVLLMRDGFNAHDYRYHVHPESLPLLRPRKGDKVAYAWGFAHHGGEGWDEVVGLISANDEIYPTTGSGEVCVLMDSGEHPYISRITRIFERNGIPFHMPESEVL